MENKHVYRKKTILVVILILVGVLVVSRYIYINNKYPKPILQAHELNEAVEYNGVKITAKEFELIEEEELSKMDLSEVKKYNERGEKIKSAMVTLNIKNESDEVKRVESYVFELSTIDWRNGVNLEMFNEINDEKAKLYLELKPGEEVTNKYPYTMITDQFTDKCWNNIEDEKFKLVLDLYPVNKFINLN
ncbi:MAG: hypothetical protein ACRCW0_09370 [Clostridium sp.]